jgi:predicted nucleotidyltransferase
MLVQEIIKIATPILIKNRVKKAALFGSMARQEFNEKSDIDILVEVDDSCSLLDFIGIKIDLEDAFHRKVDLVEYKSVREELKKHILSDPILIYG